MFGAYLPHKRPTEECAVHVTGQSVISMLQVFGIGWRDWGQGFSAMIRLAGPQTGGHPPTGVS